MLDYTHVSIQVIDDGEDSDNATPEKTVTVSVGDGQSLAISTK